MKGRFTLVNESQEFPHLVDAKVSAVQQQWQIDVFKHIVGDRVEMGHAMRNFRYIIDIDGNCASTRLQSILGRNNVVVKPRSDERQWFSSELKPWIHFVPVTLNPFEVNSNEVYNWVKENRVVRQYSDLAGIMEWSARNPEQMVEIIKNANIFYKNYLSREAVKCYMACLVDEVHRVTSFSARFVVDYLTASLNYEDYTESDVWKTSMSSHDRAEAEPAPKSRLSFQE